MRAIAEQIGDVGAIVMAILGPVLFTLLLVCGNTMAQSVRERTNRLAVMKTLGFTDGRVMGLVLIESFVLPLLAGGAGLRRGCSFSGRIRLVAPSPMAAVTFEMALGC